MDGVQPDVALGSRLSPADEQELDARFRTALMIRLAIVGAVVALLVVLYLVGTMDGMPEPTAQADILALVFAVMGLGSVSFGYLVPRFVPVARRLSQLPSGAPSVAQVLGALTTQGIMQAAFCEVPALLGFVLAFMGASPPVYLPFFLVALAALLTTLPRRTAWEQAVVEATHLAVPSGQ